MATTVYFATNRLVTNANDPAAGYQASMVPALRPDLMTYGQATVDQVNPNSNNAGIITGISNITTGDFSDAIKGRISNPGNNILVFAHGYANTFEAAITRAAANREWLAASGQSGTDTTVIAFCWPSIGESFGGFPDILGPYRVDRSMARNCGLAMMSFLSRIQPTLSAAAKNESARCTLIAHSMGNLVLEAGLESWFLNGNGPGTFFNLSVLAASDCDYDCFEQPPTASMKGLTQLSERIAFFFSSTDYVLSASNVINPIKRLGLSGPHNMADPRSFPRTRFGMHDCSLIRDFDFGIPTSHQYYRLSPSVRAMIAAEMAGAGIVTT
jgi:esterase/lipase superfamily enzyme